MQNRNQRQAKSVSNRRTARGSALAEFGPTLGILLLMLFFPLVDILALGADYASCMVLNYCQLREAALCSKQDAQSASGPVINGLPVTWAKEGLGRFVNLADSVDTTVNYESTNTIMNSTLKDEYVQVTTKVTANPFLTIPLFPGVPGLGAPVTFQLSTERLLETTSSKS
jgi:hypothetical protein